MADVAPGSVAVCPNHPNSEAKVRCNSCLRPVCFECIITTPHGKFCSEKCREGADATRQRVEDLNSRGKSGPKLPIGMLVTLAVLIIGGVWGWQHQTVLLHLYHQYVH